MKAKRYYCSTCNNEHYFGHDEVGAMIEMLRCKKGERQPMTDESIDPPTIEPTCQGYTLAQALPGLIEFDETKGESGNSDLQLWVWVLKQLLIVMTDDESRVYLSRIVRDMLSEERITAGYGLGDVKGLIEWLSGNGYDV